MSVKAIYKLFGNQEIINQKETVSFTIGNFDGVHAGHVYLIDQLKKLNAGIPIAILTFHPHPVSFFSPKNPKTLLSTLEDKVSLLLKIGVDVVVVQQFDNDFASLSSDEFCMWLKNNFNIYSVIIGHDFQYGKQRKGDFAHMKNFASKENWKIVQIPAFKMLDGQVVSSSLIRGALTCGDVEEVEKFLTRPYCLPGIVVKGDQRGRLIGFPTANIQLDDILVIPRYGVYACLVEIESNGVLLPAVMNCGVRPTIASGLKLQIEAHILDFSQEIYGSRVRFHVKKFIRGEMKFENLDELKQQIGKDVLLASQYFSINN